MRTPEQIIDTEYCKEGTTLADVVRLAVQEAVEEIIETFDTNAHDREIRDHFKKAGY